MSKGGELAACTSCTVQVLLPKTEGGTAPVPFWPWHHLGRRSRPGQHLHHIRGSGRVPTPKTCHTKNGFENGCRFDTTLNNEWLMFLVFRLRSIWIINAEQWNVWKNKDLYDQRASSEFKSNEISSVCSCNYPTNFQIGISLLNSIWVGMLRRDHLSHPSNGGKINHRNW